MRNINKVLIANRGEIACRIIKTCHRLGISTVTVYSKHDSNHPHTTMSNESILLPGNTLEETYLNAKAVIDIAKKTKCDAIHPGI